MYIKKRFILICYRRFKDNITITVWNEESPKCDFHFPTSKERRQREEAAPLGLSITPTMHYIGGGGVGGGAFLCAKAAYDCPSAAPSVLEIIHIHLQVSMIMHKIFHFKPKHLSVTALQTSHKQP